MQGHPPVLEKEKRGKGDEMGWRFPLSLFVENVLTFGSSGIS
jgi:hypothetical protein